MGRRLLYEIFAFVGYLGFYLLAGLIALPIVLLLLRLEEGVAHWPVSALITVPLRVLCYALMCVTCMGAILAALYLVLRVRTAAGERRRDSGTS
jgi:hypothetical protein